MEKKLDLLSDFQLGEWLVRPSLNQLVSTEWDKGNDYFPATSMQISNIHAGTGVNNVIPGQLELIFNFRFSTESTPASLQETTESILQQHNVSYEADWQVSGMPFLTQQGELIPAVQDAIRSHCGIETELSTSGGTSDGRFIAPAGVQVVELGPNNATIHKVNEQVRVHELADLSIIYAKIMHTLLT